MRVAILGPLRVTEGSGTIEIPGPRVRALLVRLAWDCGRMVGPESLAGAVWPDEPVDHPTAAIQSLVSRLRRALPDSAIRTGPAGSYQLDAPADAVDARRFERLTADARRALRGGAITQAAELSEQALSLWTGDPLLDAGRAAFAEAARARLGELWLNVVEDRLEADLMLGRTQAVVAELEALIQAHPLRERLRALAMRGLSAEGRGGEALGLYETSRRLLADELGTDPGPQLQREYLAVLRGEQATPAPTALPTPLTVLIGRETDGAAVREMVSVHRLVTLTGPGGAGKTRLAIRVASDRPDPVRQGCWLVELSSCPSAQQVASAVLAMVGPARLAAPEPAVDPLLRLREVLGRKHVLIVLDNCEHVIDGAAAVSAALLAACPGVRILATSREPLGVAGERLYPVHPLPVPEPGVADRNAPAVQLFLDRAQAARPDFRAGEDDLPVVGEICRTLDGLPLAIELAAARMRSITVAQLASRLTDRFALLAAESRTLPPRHRTLAAMVGWSWDLLGPELQQQAARLAVFPGLFTAAAADRVGVGWAAVDTLVDKSLVQPANGRYRMLDTVRAYARTRLDISGLTQEARAAHLDYLLAVVEDHAGRLRSRDQVAALAVLAAERENLTAAFAFAIESRNAEAACRLAAAVAQFWVIRDGHADTARRMHDALAVPSAVAPEPVVEVAVQYLLNAILAGQRPDTDLVAERIPAATGGRSVVDSLLATVAGDPVAAIAAAAIPVPQEDSWRRARRALVGAIASGTAADIAAMCRGLHAAAGLYLAAGDRFGRALALTFSGLADDLRGDIDTATMELTEAAALVRDLGAPDRFQRAWLAHLHAKAGHRDDAEHMLRDLLRQTVGADAGLAHLFAAELARFDGEFDLAAAHLAQASEGLSGQQEALLWLAHAQLAIVRDDLDAAAEFLHMSLDAAVITPDMPMIAAVAVGIATLLCATGRHHAAAEALGAAHILRGTAAVADPDVRSVRTRLAERLGLDFERCYQRGHDHIPARAVEFVTTALSTGSEPGSAVTAR